MANEREIFRTTHAQIDESERGGEPPLEIWGDEISGGKVIYVCIPTHI